ncbi:6211_t:CDS:2 [Paraglomus occultum]|uniref:6211_t:CDS:1 n=1 Tax=Paraglomus occultum TaxID=144539 RepID=A0A9N8VLT0_9GLOM|nr:6211_t:CDS:2 [Paraglomus occultum]
MSTSSTEKHLTYFINKWCLAKFLRRSRGKNFPRATIDYRAEYDTYKRVFMSQSNSVERQRLCAEFEGDKFSEPVIKYWVGWCQQWGKNDKDRIPPEARNFLDMVLVQKWANHGYLEAEAMAGHNYNVLPSGKVVQTVLNDNDVKVQVSEADLKFLKSTQDITQRVDVPVDENPTTITEDTPPIIIPGTTGFPVGFSRYIFNIEGCNRFEDQPGHKVDYDLMWCDENKREWELAIGEFSGKPFKPDEDKIYTDRCKLFRGMKDILDDRLLAIMRDRLSQQAYEIA